MIAYLDCYSGVSGDMFLGSMLDLGLPLEKLREQLELLPVRGYALEAQRVTDQGIAGTRLLVEIDESAEVGHRHLSDILSLIESSGLSAKVKATASEVFRNLAAAEAAVHGTGIDHVHFHEVGAVDAIVDIVGAAIAVEALGIERVACSPLPLGSGTVRCAHGLLPVPAPATLKLLATFGAPCRANDVEAELVTPTGAALACTLAKFERPEMRVRKAGYGFGSKKLPWPNALRVWLGDETRGADQDEIAVIEANVDDSTPEMLGAAMDALLAEGALDVTFEPLQMKKNRPGVKLTVLAEMRDASRLGGRVLDLTSTLGVRYHTCGRIKAERRAVTVSTPWGDVAVKLKVWGEAISCHPEYDDCLRVAAAAGVDVADVYRVALAAGRELR